jgi:hypothetical protein
MGSSQSWIMAWTTLQREFMNLTLMGDFLRLPLHSMMPERMISKRKVILMIAR